MFIHQNAYTTRILEKYKMIKANPVSTPSDPNTIQSETNLIDQEPVNVSFREAVGSLMFLPSLTRPDIALAVNIVSRYTNNYKHCHWSAVKRIFKYLLGTKNCGLVYGSQDEHETLTGYSDADFAGDLDTRRSTTGYIFIILFHYRKYASHMGLTETEISYSQHYRIRIRGSSNCSKRDSLASSNVERFRLQNILSNYTTY